VPLFPSGLFSLFSSSFFPQPFLFSAIFITFTSFPFVAGQRSFFFGVSAGQDNHFSFLQRRHLFNNPFPSSSTTQHTLFDGRSDSRRFNSLSFFRRQSPFFLQLLGKISQKEICEGKRSNSTGQGNCA
jgi:hypothetical protein